MPCGPNVNEPNETSAEKNKNGSGPRPLANVRAEQNVVARTVSYLRARNAAAGHS